MFVLLRSLPRPMASGWRASLWASWQLVGALWAGALPAARLGVGACGGGLFRGCESLLLVVMARHGQRCARPLVCAGLYALVPSPSSEAAPAGVPAHIRDVRFEGASRLVRIAPEAAPQAQLVLRARGAVPAVGALVHVTVGDGWILPKAENGAIAIPQAQAAE